MNIIVTVHYGDIQIDEESLSLNGIVWHPARDIIMMLILYTRYN